MSFDLPSMERGELCHDRCMILLLADYMQDTGAAELNAKPRCAGSVLSAGFGDFGRCRDGIAGVGVGLGAWRCGFGGGSDIEYKPQTGYF